MKKKGPNPYCALGESLVWRTRGDRRFSWDAATTISWIQRQVYELRQLGGWWCSMPIGREPEEQRNMRVTDSRSNPTGCHAALPLRQDRYSTQLLFDEHGGCSNRAPLCTLSIGHFTTCSVASSLRFGSRSNPLWSLLVLSRAQLHEMVIQQRPQARKDFSTCSCDTHRRRQKSPTPP